MLAQLSIAPDPRPGSSKPSQAVRSVRQRDAPQTHWTTFENEARATTTHGAAVSWTALTWARSGALAETAGEAAALEQEQARLRYVVASKTAPPTFVLFVNDGALITAAYQRYLETEDCLGLSDQTS